MENQKEFCEKLYDKYKKLEEEAKTGAETQDAMKSIGEFSHSKHFFPEKITEKNKIKEELKNKCNSFLSSEQKFELAKD